MAGCRTMADALVERAQKYDITHELYVLSTSNHINLLSTPINDRAPLPIRSNVLTSIIDPKLEEMTVLCLTANVLCVDLSHQPFTETTEMPRWSFYCYVNRLLFDHSLDAVWIKYNG